ncbi:MAG: hypothetical protein PHZ26_02125 [Candidatus Gracilibacteria bacterium]|nr:hypothetical protein [Candidatus Gracilibacteria bacterium]MDD2908532.1 hypothetical protein [Candidatus Gracilibacteria bacterium]
MNKEKTSEQIEVTTHKNEVTSFIPTTIEKVKETSQEILFEDVCKYFSIEKEKGLISMNLSLIPDREKLLAILDVFFSKYYIENINYENFSKLIYNFDELKLKGESLQIGLKITEFKDARREKYKIFILNKSEYKGELIRVECTFSRIYFEIGNGKEAIFDFKLDEFIAYMFTKSIRYGLDIKEISKGLISQSHKGIIAKNLDPSIGNPSSLEVLVNLERDEKPIEVGENENVNFKKFKCIFPTINHKENEGLLAIKNQPTLGKNGMQIDGRIISGLLGEDKITLQVLCGNGTSFTEDETKAYIRATESGFINVEKDSDAVGAQRLRKISVDKNKSEKINIGPKTGTLDVTCCDKFSLSGNVDKNYELIANNVRIENGNVEGTVTSVKGNINIFGNVINGNIIALDGNAFMTGRVITSSYVESLKGDIEIDYAEYSTIIGKNVKVKKAIGCIIICDNLDAEEINACNLLIKKSIKIDKLDAKFHKGEKNSLKTKDTRIILLFKKNILGNIEMLKKIKRKMAIYLNKDSSSPEALEKMEELNSLLNQISSDQEKKEQEINKSEYSININYGAFEENISIRLADFFESFNIENLGNLHNEKGVNEKEIFLEKLTHLFSEWDNDHVGKLMLGDFEYNKYTDYTSILNLDFDKIKEIIVEEINEACSIRNPKETRINGIERREEYRMDFGYVKKENGIDLDIILNEEVPMKIDGKEGFLKDISVGGIGFYLNKSDINLEEDMFYQENDIVDLSLKLEGLGGKEKIFNLKLILTFRKEIGNKIVFGAKFIGLRGKIDTEMRQCIKKFEIEKMKKARELQQASILDKK